MKLKNTLIICLAMFSITVVGGPEKEMATISVISFRPIGISDNLALSLQEHLESNLLQLDMYEVLTRSDVGVILEENKFLQSGVCQSKECLVETGHLLGVEKIITGTISKIGFTYNIVLKLIDVKSGKLESSVNSRHSGTVDSLLTVVENAVQKLCKYNKPDIVKITKVKTDTIPLAEVVKDSIADSTYFNNIMSQTLTGKEEHTLYVPHKENSVKPEVSKQGKVIGISAAGILSAVAALVIANSIF